jgi:hypothetical protein
MALGATRGHKHVGIQEIERIWESLEAGDYLAVFQYGFRDHNWCAKKKELLRKVIGEGIREQPFTSMCYFWAQKTKN